MGMSQEPSQARSKCRGKDEAAPAAEGKGCAKPQLQKEGEMLLGEENVQLFPWRVRNPWRRIRDSTAQFGDGSDELTALPVAVGGSCWDSPFSSVQPDSLYLLDVPFVPKFLGRNQRPPAFNQYSFKALRAVGCSG